MDPHFKASHSGSAARVSGETSSIVETEPKSGGEHEWEQMSFLDCLIRRSHSPGMKKMEYTEKIWAFARLNILGATSLFVRYLGTLYALTSGCNRRACSRNMSCSKYRSRGLRPFLLTRYSTFVIESRRSQGKEYINVPKHDLQAVD